MKWTPEVIALMREHAARGLSGPEIAELVGSTPNTVRTVASKLKIKLSGVRYAVRHRRRAERAASKPDLSALPPHDRVKILARCDLEHEIALAKAEAATAPLYRPGWARLLG